MGSQGPSARVVIGADAEIAREGVTKCLSDVEGIEVVAATGKLSHVGSYARGHDADVVLLAPRPETAADAAEVIDAIAEVRQAGSSAPVVVLSYITDAYVARQVLHDGATGYVLAWQSVNDLADAIRLAAERKLYVSPRLGVEIARIDAADDGLTDREAEIARLIALGYSNAQIGKELFLSTRTIESHRSRLTQKLGVEDRRELVSWAIEHHMIP